MCASLSTQLSTRLSAQLSSQLVTTSAIMSSTMTSQHMMTNVSNISESSELSKRLTQMHVTDRPEPFDRHDRHAESAANTSNMSRQPTIVCDDVDDQLVCEPFVCRMCEEVSKTLSRSASTASLTVPQSIEIDNEKKRPPLQHNSRHVSRDDSREAHEQMSMETIDAMQATRLTSSTHS